MRRKSSPILPAITLAAAIFASIPHPAGAQSRGAGTFDEVWAYVVQGDESAAQGAAGITDLAYFSASINNRGELAGVPSFAKLGGSKARKHLVVAEVRNPALTHFVLAPEFGLRDKLVADIGTASVPYHGLQIDFESVASYDTANFLMFLSLLKKRMPDKILSVALPARFKPVGEAYDYASIAAVADRIVIMAYDEHWSGSKPGSIASPSWTSKVASYVMNSIGKDKAVMGLPFYGRAWADKDPTGAYRFTSTQRVMAEKNAEPLRDTEGSPFFRFTETIEYVLYFEDRESLLLKMDLYRKNGLTKIGFWRLGLEDAGIWKHMQTEDAIALRETAEDNQASPLKGKMPREE